MDKNRIDLIKAYTGLIAMWLFVLIALSGLINLFWDIKRDFFIAMIGFLGSIIGGAMTLVGVRITLKDQNKKYIDQQTLSNRSILQIGEVYNAHIKLNNYKSKMKRRIICTEPYNLAEALGLIDGHNFVIVSNPGPARVLNCNINIAITFEITFEVWKTKALVPNIDINEEVYVPIDKIPFKDSYKITEIEIEYNTLSNEKILIRRVFDREMKSYDRQSQISDNIYLINESGEKIFLMETFGTKDQWIYVEG